MKLNKTGQRVLSILIRRTLLGYDKYPTHRPKRQSAEDAFLRTISQDELGSVANLLMDAGTLASQPSEQTWSPEYVPPQERYCPACEQAPCCQASVAAL
jgi:hypothetical protein